VLADGGGVRAEDVGARCQAVRGQAARGWDARDQESRVDRVAQGLTGGVGGAGARAGSIGWTCGVRLVGWVQMMDL
jgi:hypothetical protein